MLGWNVKKKSKKIYEKFAQKKRNFDEPEDGKSIKDRV
jgi:hypothetical protein